jgi:hypothetical protein
MGSNVDCVDRRKDVHRTTDKEIDRERTKKIKTRRNLVAVLNKGRGQCAGYAAGNADGQSHS